MTAPALADRRALVTGGGRGIGAAIAEALTGAGAAVMVAARSAAEVEAVAARLRARGANARAATCDVTDEASVRRLGEEARRELGGVDLLVNNAGGAGAAPLPRIALEDWNRMFAVNATAAFLCTREFAPAMAERGFGRIVNVASIAGLTGARYIAHYAASKHAVVGLTRATAAEYAGTGVTANAVCPAYVDTPLTARSVADVQARTGRTREAALEAILASAGQRQLIAPAEVAERVVALCAGADTGLALVVTGAAAGETPFEIVNPAALGAPKGWNNGLVAPAGARILFIAGQAGWETGAPGTPPAFVDQFARALDKVLAVLTAAGGSAGDIARLTLYVTDLAAYRDSTKALGRVWRERFGGYYPAMALVEVKGLVDHGALIEIEATAALGGAR